jgi:ribosomal protein S18 acetylase RimI-like enzyme
MQPMIRPLEERDHDAVIALSLLAWAPVFASLEGVLGEAGGYPQMHPDWRADQRRAVAAVCTEADTHVWVAEIDSTVAGFVGVRLDHEASIGEIYMVAVHPEHQRNGIGSHLTSFALGWIKDSFAGSVRLRDHAINAALNA